MNVLTIEIGMPDDGMTPDAFRRKADAFCHEMRVEGDDPPPDTLEEMAATRAPAAAIPSEEVLPDPAESEAPADYVPPDFDPDA